MKIIERLFCVLLAICVFNDSVVYARSPAIDYCVTSEQERREYTVGHLQSIAYNTGSYLAVGTFTSAFSTDLKIWTEVIHDEPLRNMHDVVWDGRNYLAVNGGSISTTRDGVNWRHHSVAIYPRRKLDLRGVASFRGKIVAVGRQNNNSGVIVSGTLNSTWKTVHDNLGIVFVDSVIEARDEILIGVYSSTVPIGLSSSNGIDWKKSESFNWVRPSQVTTFHNIDWNGSHYAAVGIFGDLRISQNGISWRRIKPDVANKWDLFRGVAWKGDELVVVGQCGGILKGTIDGPWTRHRSGTRMWLHDVVWTGKRFVVVGGHSTRNESSNSVEGTGIILTSEDGESWTDVTPRINQ